MEIKDHCRLLYENLFERISLFSDNFTGRYFNILYY